LIRRWGWCDCHCGYLYELFPEGTLAQGCRLAGLEPPAGAQDKGMGSAV